MKFNGGHKGPCSISHRTKRCVKSDKACNECELSEKGYCKKKSNKTKKNKRTNSNKKNNKNDNKKISKKSFKDTQMEDSTVIAKYLLFNSYTGINFDKFNNIKDLKQYIIDNKFYNQGIRTKNRGVKTKYDELKDFIDSSYNFGDVIVYNDDDLSTALIIGKNGKLINKTNTYGYLYIPYEITQYVTDALEKFKNMDLMYIELRHDDRLITKLHKVNKIDDSQINSEYKYLYDSYDQILYIMTPLEEFEIEVDSA